MRSPSARSLTIALAAAVGLLALTGCGGDDTPAAGGTPTVTSPVTTPTMPSAGTPSTPTRTTATPPATTPAQTADVTVEVTIAGGKVSAGGQAVVKAKSGQSVQIKGVSDVAESLHVHGYDKTLDLKPGKPASVVYTADTKGIFEVETHDSGKLVFKLQVS